MTKSARKATLLALSFAMLTGFDTASYALPAYTITDLGAMGVHGEAQPWGVNNSGQVTGGRITPSGEVHAFVYSNGAFQDLGTPGGPYSTGTDINNSGLVSGYGSSNGGPNRGFVYNNGMRTDIGALAGPAGPTWASGINNLGQVTGTTEFPGSPGNTSVAFIYSNGVMRSIGTLSGNQAYGSDINDLGQVAGAGMIADLINGASAYHAFFYSDGAMRDIGTLGGKDSSAAGLNNAGQVVGAATTSNGAQHAFLYSNGVMIDIDLFAPSLYGSGASDINNLGQVVGLSDSRAFIFSDGVYTDLNSLPAVQAAGWDVLGQANAISDNGNIVGIGQIHGEPLHGFLLMPVGQVPEPSVILLMLAGALVFIGLHNVRSRHAPELLDAAETLEPSKLAKAASSAALLPAV